MFWIIIVGTLTLGLIFMLLGVGDSVATNLRNLREPVTQADLIVKQVKAEDPDAQLVGKTEQTLTFRLSDGQYKLVTSMGKLFTQDGQEINTSFKSGKGEWVAETTSAVDYILQVRGDGSRRYTPRKNNPNEYIEFGVLERFIDDTWQILPIKEAQIKDNRIFWELEDYTLEYWATPWGMKVNLIIDSPTENYPLRWATTYNNLVREGDTIISSYTGEEITTFVPPRWYDSAEQPVDREVDSSIDDSYITLEPPDLTGAIYPVLIDPSATFQPAVSGDDGYINPNFNNSNNYMLFGEDSTVSQVHNTFLRFPSVNIPKGSRITAANIDFRTTTNTYIPTTCTIRIYGMAEDNHVAPTTAAEHTNDHSVHTTAYTDWVFTLIDANDSLLATPDISSAVQEVIDRSGWASGNAVGIHVDENMGEIESTQGVASWDHVTYSAPILNITYNPRKTIIITDARE